MIQGLKFYLMCVWENEKHQFLHNIFGINCKEILQLVHWHESVYLQKRLQGGGKKSITQLKWINRLQKQCMIDIYSWVSCFCTLTYHYVPLKLNMASHLFVHNILALIGKWWSIHHGSIGHWICKEAAHSRILTSRWHFSHIITWTIVVLVVHGWRNRTGVIKEKRTSTGWRCSGSGFCCMEKNNFSNT